MGTIELTKNDLEKNTRMTMVGILNDNLADAIDMTLQAKQAHWNVKGPGFFQLHELFDRVYEEATGWVDLMAERAVQLGGVADGTLQTTAQRSRLPQYGRDLLSGNDHVDALSGSLAVFCKLVRESIESADKVGDAGTADLFTEISRGADKMLWFVEAHLHTDR
jgi:starvation-inducible DNA-binding protein